MLYVDFEKAVAEMLNSQDEIHIKIPCGKSTVDLANAVITVNKNGRLHASWKRKNSQWSTDAEFFPASDGETKVRWSDTCHIQVKMAR
jgi:hypothetical protein